MVVCVEEVIQFSLVWSLFVFFCFFLLRSGGDEALKWRE